MLYNLYIDESQTHDAAAPLCVAGYLFKDYKARQLETQWTSVLQSYQVTAFHMVDCAHGNDEFKRLSLDQRIGLEVNCISLIKRHALIGLAASVIPNDFVSTIPYHRNLGDAYNFLLWMVILTARNWLSNVGLSGKISYLFEAGHKHQSESERIMKTTFANDAHQIGYAGHAFVEKRALGAVQAADLLAWQFHTDLRHRRERKSRRKDYAALISGRPEHLLREFANDDLVEIFEDMKLKDAWARQPNR